MRQQQMDFAYASEIGTVPQPANARAGVEHDQGALAGTYLDTRRVAAVAHGFRARAGDRPTTAPESRPHGLLRILCGGLLPEDRNHADEFVRMREEGKRRRRHDSLPTVEASDVCDPVCGPALEQSSAGSHLG